MNGKVDDLISRQAAIDAVESAKTARTPDGEIYVAKLNAEMNIQILPSTQQWIPCSERLPIAQEEVIVSCHDDSGDTSYDYTTCGWVTNDGEYWIADNEINSHVVAWMPLPKPYEAEKERIMSDDLISREKTSNEILLLMKDMKLTSGDTTVWQDCIISPTEAANTLRWMPSVDAVEVVRCKDCDYYTAEERWCRRLGLCGAFGEDDFCCHGERKKE